MFSLIDNTTGQQWDDYSTEAKLRTAARLYAIQHPKSSISVTIKGTTTRIR